MKQESARSSSRRAAAAAPLRVRETIIKTAATARAVYVRGFADFIRLFIAGAMAI